MAPQLLISDLYSMKNKKEQTKIKTYDTIIEKCHSKIKMIASQGGMNVFFEIPFILLGYPLYDINDCVEYIVDVLRKNGLLVQILPYPNSNTIYISWKPTDVKATKQLECNMKTNAPNKNILNSNPFAHVVNTSYESGKKSKFNPFRQF